MSRLVTGHRDPRLARGARFALAAVAGFAFAVAFAAGSRAPDTSDTVLPRTPVAERTNGAAPATAPRFEPIRDLPDLVPARRVVARRAPVATAPTPEATVATTPTTTA